jgi:hypothetical protein
MKEYESMELSSENISIVQFETLSNGDEMYGFK